MNKIFSIIFGAVLIGISFDASAQEERREGKDQGGFDKEAFETRRNAFITAEVGLTPEEAAQFIPLCDELRQKKFELGHEYRKLAKEIRRKKDPTDADYNRVVEENLEADIKSAQLEKEYFLKFKEILSPEKIYKYRDAEYKFMRDYMRGHRDMRKEDRQRK